LFVDEQTDSVDEHRQPSGLRWNFDGFDGRLRSASQRSPSVQAMRLKLLCE
jgi:hypothetical protein